MTGVLLALQLLTLAALGLLAWLYFRLRRSAAALAAQAARVLPAAVPPLEGKPALIVIEILNPMELAARESWFAQAFGNLTPALVRREVYRQTHKIIQEELDKRGVVANVKLHA